MVLGDVLSGLAAADRGVEQGIGNRKALERKGMQELLAQRLPTRRSRTTTVSSRVGVSRISKSRLTGRGTLSTYRRSRADLKDAEIRRPKRLPVFLNPEDETRFSVASAAQSCPRMRLSAVR
jgi:hypothetical protein